MILQARTALLAAKGPSRQLDALVASTLSPDMLWRGRPLGNRHHSMAFTRGVENADRFVQIALPGYGWTISSSPGRGVPNAMVWPQDDGIEGDGDGATPALALLIAALQIGIELTDWPILAAAERPWRA